MNYSVREFRQGLKEALDRAENGEAVTIERKGVFYNVSLIGKPISNTPAVERMDGNFGGNVPVGASAPAVSVSSKDLYDEAKQMEKELEDNLKYNQDPDSRFKQEKEGKEAIKAKWAEYHASKEQ